MPRSANASRAFTILEPRDYRGIYLSKPSLQLPSPRSRLPGENLRLCCKAMKADLLETVKALPLTERIELAEALWESITDEGHEPPLTPAQAEELEWISGRALRDALT